ncbi:MAG: modC [Paucimonas sp.]|nr:modC [Paucimonas sp.]
MSERAIHARFNIDQGSFALHADLALPGRGVTAFLGRSGAGKTTLLRAIAGLERHVGYLKVNDEVWQDDEIGLFVPTFRRALGYVFQEASLLPHLNVRRNLEFGWKRIPPSSRKLEWKPVLSLLGIEHLLQRYPDGLSGGERQRVAIARSLLTSPDLLLMDEPLASLDPTRREEVLPYLERIHDELAIPMLYVSHSPDEVARLADHVVLLEAGRVLASGTIAEVSSRLDLPTAFEESAAVVVEGKVESHDPHYGISRLRVAGSLVQVAGCGPAVGDRVRLRILARDVSVALAAHDDMSVLNQLPAEVMAEAPSNNNAHVILRLQAEGMPLLARVTRQSRDRLGILPGKRNLVHDA